MKFRKELLKTNFVYINIENEEKRKELIKKAMSGEISGEEMREKSKKLKVIYSEEEYKKLIKPAL
jgi:hypothetical protein